MLDVSLCVRRPIQSETPRYVLDRASFSAHHLYPHQGRFAIFAELGTAQRECAISPPPQQPSRPRLPARS
jgi:hypothetical protein